ncbi:hypothetical protein E2C01_049831 [Portunus trituberculatus]|uniref:Uncharacterized protein n=1 Tax=Portunus trituberculatus TaxID=210409 RepID=A0A5B7GE68_PORTR|nr:hypothetical protein [Portunus trituberculatus]
MSKRGYFRVFLKLRIAGKTHYLSNVVKYVKNRLFSCIPVF